MRQLPSNFVSSHSSAHELFRLPGQQRTVQAWLNSLDLEACEDARKELGYDQMDLIVDGDEEEGADIIAAVEAIDNIKKPVVKKFSASWRSCAVGTKTFDRIMRMRTKGTFGSPAGG